MTTELRNTRFNGIVGSPGSGKSTYAALAVRNYPRNVIVWKHTINVDDKAFKFLPEKTMDNWRKGAKPGEPVKCKMGGTEADYATLLEWIKTDYRNGLLVVDDCSIFEDGKLSPNMRHLVAMRRHYGIDIWLIYHGFSAFPIDQYKFINHLVIFNTNDEIGYKKNKIPKFNEVQNAINISRKTFASYKPTDPRRYKPEVVTLSL